MMRKQNNVVKYYLAVLLLTFSANFTHADLIIGNDLEKHIFYIEEEKVVKDKELLQKAGELFLKFFTTNSFEELEEIMERKSYKQYKKLFLDSGKSEEKFFSTRPKEIKEFKIIKVLKGEERYQVLLKWVDGSDFTEYSYFGFIKTPEGELLIKTGSIDTSKDPLGKAMGYLNYDSSLKILKE